MVCNTTIQTIPVSCLAPRNPRINERWLGWSSHRLGCRWCQQMLNFQFPGEGFGAGFIAGSFLVVASGDASDSSDGQLEFFDGLNMTQLGEWALPGIPRGFTFDHSGGIIVANHTGSWWVLIPDTDGDGVIDEEDAFPNNSLQWSDFDGDGFGDNNAPGAGGDGCPETWGTSSIDRGCQIRW